MVNSCRSAAIWAAMGIALVALFPAGTGSFTVTHGPVTAVRAVIDHVLEFTPISLAPVALLAQRELRVFRGLAPAELVNPDATPIPALRC